MLDMIALLGARALGGALLAGLLDGLMRLVMLTALWGNPLGQHELWARQVGFALASASVLALGNALARELARLRPGAVGAALAAVPAQLVALAALYALAGPAGQADLDLPLLRTPAVLAVGAAIAAGATSRRPVRGAAMAGAYALAACHAVFGEGPPGLPSESHVPGGAGAAIVAGWLEGYALGAGLGLAATWTALPRRTSRVLAAAALAGALAVAALRADAVALVQQRIAELEPLIARVRAHPRFADPLFERWVSDVRTREEKAADIAARLPWYLLRFPALLAEPWRRRTPHAELLRVFEEAELILHTLLDEPLPPWAPRTATGHLLGLVRGFRVPAVLEYQEHFRRDVLAVYRGGVPLFAVGVIDIEDPARSDYDRNLAAGRDITLPGGVPARSFPRGTRRLVLAGDFIYEVWAPTEALRLRVIARLQSGPPLSPGDDLATPDVLIPGGSGPAAVRARADTDPAGAAIATARGWLAQGLHPYFGDVHTHASSTLGGSVPPCVAAANALSQFAHFHALTEHFSAIGNAPVARWIAENAPGSTFIPGEELTLGAAHLTALGLTRWIPVPWFAFTAPPGDFVHLIEDQQALPVLAHALYPMNAWQRSALEHGRAMGLAAVEVTQWMPDGVYESVREALPTLGGSDAHCGCFAGGARTLVLARDGSLPSLLEAIRAGRSLGLRLDQPLLSRGSPAMRAALWLLLTEPGRLQRELEATWRGAEVARRPVLRE